MGTVSAASTSDSNLDSIDTAEADPSCAPNANGGCEPTPAATDSVHDAAADPVPTFAAASNLWSSATHSASLDAQIDKLNPGESIKLGYGGSVGAGLEVSGKRELEIARTPSGKYEIATAAEVGVGAKLEAGDAGEGAEVKAEFQVGGKKTMEFDSADDAKAAANFFVGGALVDAGVSTLPAVRGVVDEGWDLAHPGQKALADANVKSIELSGSLGGALEASAGEKGKAALAGLTGKVAGQTAVALSVELSHGAPSAIVVETRAKLSASAGALTTLGGHEMKFGGNFEGEAEASVQEKFAIPPGTSLEQLQRDPAGTLSKIAASGADPEIRTKISFKGQIADQRVEGSFTAPGDPSAYATPEIRAALGSGDFASAAADLSRVPGFSGEAWAVKQHGWSGNFEAGVGEFTAGAELTATRTERTQKLFSYGNSGSEG